MFLRRWLSPGRFLLGTTGRLLAPHPLRAKETAYQTPPFFIVSNGRSGTTLLRAMLIQNPIVHIPPEFKLIGPLFGQYRRMLRYLPWEYTVRLFGAAVAGSLTLIQWEMALNDFYTLAEGLPPSKRSLTNLIHLFYMCHAQQVKAGADALMGLNKAM